LCRADNPKALVEMYFHTEKFADYFNEHMRRWVDTVSASLSEVLSA
jgi:hypothetical protein